MIVTCRRSAFAIPLHPPPPAVDDADGARVVAVGRGQRGLVRERDGGAALGGARRCGGDAQLVHGARLRLPPRIAHLLEALVREEGGRRELITLPGAIARERDGGEQRREPDRDDADGHDDLDQGDPAPVADGRSQGRRPQGVMLTRPDVATTTWTSVLDCVCVIV